MISANVGRRTLYALILFGFLSAFISLWVRCRGGSCTFESVKPVIASLLTHYVPLIGILVGFYFSERISTDTASATSLEALSLAVVLVGVWVLAPPVLLALSETGEAAVRLLESVAVFGSSLASASLAYFFAKTGKSASRAVNPT
jgi:hypothetical protein